MPTPLRRPDEPRARFPWQAAQQAPARPPERSRRERFEAALKVMTSHRRSHVALARAVREVLDERLYEERYETVEAFAAAELGMSRARAYQLRTLAIVADNVGEHGEHMLESGLS